jgi:hypothetical protein
MTPDEKEDTLLSSSQMIICTVQLDDNQKDNKMERRKLSSSQAVSSRLLSSYMLTPNEK